MKQILFPVILLLLLATGLFAQKPDKQAQKYSGTITADDLRARLSVIAGPEMEGRETATAGQRKAATYIEDHFRKIGLAGPVEGGYQQSYQIYTDSVAQASVAINGKELEKGKDFMLPGNNYSFSIKVSEVVFAGYGISDSLRDDYAGLDVAGKVVLVLGTMPQGYPQRYVNKQAFAARHGAAAVVAVMPNLPQGGGMRRGGPEGWPYLNAYRESVPPNLCVLTGAAVPALTGQTFEALQEAAQKPGAVFKTRLAIDFQKATRSLSSSNVLGYLEGTDLKDELIVVTAHYDHLGTRNGTIYYGADDDGSGTVSVLEISEAFAQAKKDGKGPRRSILFMTVSGEEKGLWGSAYYTDNPVFPLEKTVCDLNIDMVGRIGSEYLESKDSANYVYVIGDDKLSSELRGISEGTNNLYTKLRLDYKYNDPRDPNRFYYRSDHYNFAEKGVPIIFYFNGTHADYHRPTDTPDKINYPLMAKRAQLVFHTAWNLANRDKRIPVDRNEQ